MVMTRTFSIAALVLFAACKRDAPTQPRAGRGAERPMVTPPAQRDPNVPVAHAAAVAESIAEVDAAVPVPVAAPVAEADASAEPTPPTVGVPGTYEGPGIQVVVRDDDSVELHSSDLWDAGVNTVYDSCDYLRAAVPALRRSLGVERAAVAVRACGEPDPSAPPPPVARGRAVPRPGVARPPVRRPPVRGGGA